MNDNMPMVEVKNLDVTFDTGRHRVRALAGVSFAIAPGESFGLVGESGSGKTTVLRVLAGLIRQWNGGITVAGKPLTPDRDKDAKRAIQMVFQDPYGSLHPKHTVDRILAEPLQIHGIGDIENRMKDTLEQVQLGAAFRFRYPHQLSGGQRQRVAIARALILRPKLLLLDEPTSALDVSIQAEVLNLLAKLRHELDLTYILVSHDLAVVAQLCHRLAIMRTGEIVETADSEKLAKGELTHPYSRQLLTASKGFDRAAIAAFTDL
ncbi:ABC transporter ATP-binding protein [Dongia sedimenti]|uniref:Glutathione import ATP-binding protein GsiA n=1 Tax=Dongia sedimenti TaxID=3064282 RepID=A0ABU0YGV9_9PROT|nr:ABC transporter ATP-binding protein [Rhodospirillaceae bacterium R-7]